MTTANNPQPNDTFTIDKLNEAYRAMLAIAPEAEMFRCLSPWDMYSLGQRTGIFAPFKRKIPTLFEGVLA